MTAPKAAKYDAAFFDAVSAEGSRSAPEVVRLVLELVQPDSVIDVGCGTGAFLAEFQRQGVPRILGLDGSWVSPDSLLIPRSTFRSHDLSLPLPADLGRSDLAICLEVAEHLVESAGRALVASLCALAPVVIFSAAIPRQGGTRHVNEQWPGYWADIFSLHRYDCYDCLRPRLWENSRVARWYAQNALLFAERGRNFTNGPCRPLAYVHPRQYMKATRPLSTRELSRMLLHRVLARVWRIGRNGA